MHGPKRTRTLDDSTHASDPGGLRLSEEKLRRLRPDLCGWRGKWSKFVSSVGNKLDERTYIEEQLVHGDSRAAVVMTVAPLLVAAYTDELDCVAMLRFPDCVARHFSPHPGDRLLTVNCYGGGGEHSPDLIVGARQLGRWTRFHPLIADFLTDDRDRLDVRKRQIAEAEWERTLRLGSEYLLARPGVVRDGRPVYAMLSASP